MQATNVLEWLALQFCNLITSLTRIAYIQGQITKHSITSPCCLKLEFNLTANNTLVTASQPPSCDLLGTVSSHAKRYINEEWENTRNTQAAWAEGDIKYLIEDLHIIAFEQLVLECTCEPIKPVLIHPLRTVCYLPKFQLTNYSFFRVNKHAQRTLDHSPSQSGPWNDMQRWNLHQAIQNLEFPPSPTEGMQFLTIVRIDCLDSTNVPMQSLMLWVFLFNGEPDSVLFNPRFQCYTSPTLLKNRTDSKNGVRTYAFCTSTYFHLNSQLFRKITITLHFEVLNALTSA